MLPPRDTAMVPLKMEADTVTWSFLGSSCQETKEQRRFFYTKTTGLAYQGKIGGKKEYI